ncbi:MAG: hypothetical protein ACI9QL_001224 [Candidatus Omnitrophota bacterium]|jgi:hypothetical protein
MQLRNYTILLITLLVSGAHADIGRGKLLYSQLCFTCHGPVLDGGIGPSLKDAYWRHGSSPEAMLEVINKGIPDTPMIAYEAVYPESDRLALRDFILSEQEGMREVVRSVYPRSYFNDMRLTPTLFDSVESLSQTPLPENVYYMDRSVDGVMRGQSKLYIKEPGTYFFNVRLLGRTSIYLDGEEVHYSDEKTDERTHVNKKFDLAPGAYALEILHEEKTTHSYRFHAVLSEGKGENIPLVGRSLEGNVPKVITALPEAQVIRKWIDGLPPRTLLCLLPNQVLVAYNPVDGQVLKAWHGAAVNQTPSLPDRSAKPSALLGTPITDPMPEGLSTEHLRFLYYEVHADAVHLVSDIDGTLKTVIIAPQSTQSFAVTTN